MATVSQKELEATVTFLKGVKGNIGDAIFLAGLGVKLASAGVYLLDKAGFGTAIPQGAKMALEKAKKQFGEAAFWTGVALLAVEHGGNLLVDQEAATTIDTSKVARVSIIDSVGTSKGEARSIIDSVGIVRRHPGKKEP